jgi:hypothetical protein
LNPRKNSRFHKTNHLGFPHALPPIRRNPTARTCPSAVQNPSARHGQDWATEGVNNLPKLRTLCYNKSGW